MPESIEQYQIEQYQDAILIQVQQKESRLEGTTLPPVEMDGAALYWERIGKTEAVELVTRHDDTPNIEVDHSRRKSTAIPRVWATLLDRADQVRMLVNPLNRYNQIARFAMNRAKDRLIIAALGGTSYSGQTGVTPVILPAGQKIAHGDTGLTLGKLLSTKEQMDADEVDEEAERYLVHSARQMTNLLETTEIKSREFNSVAALVEGKLANNRYMGFTFIRTELLTLTSEVRYCYAYSKGAIGLGILENVTSRITQESTKNFSWQVYLSMDMGATRVEEEQVIEIACKEA